MSSLSRTLVPVLVSIAGLGRMAADEAGDAGKGKAYFEQNCALCHTAALSEDGKAVNQQGPSLVDVVNRKAASLPGFGFSDALKKSGLTWDAATLDKFLADPGALVPGTTMPISVPEAANRRDLIAYLATLKGASTTNTASITSATSSGAPPSTTSDWDQEKPGVQHHILASNLPPPYATKSVGNGPHNVPRPEGVAPQVPEGFTVKPFATGLSNPRIIHVAPNGDIFVAETGPSRIHVLRAPDGADAPTENKVFIEHLNHPFGMAFYPPGPNPQWLYVANNNSVVRIPYHNGDLEASGQPEVIVPKLYEGSGGHSTRDLAFSLDGKQMFISVGSGSNAQEGGKKKSPNEIKAWESEHGLGAAWDKETNRADILVTDPEGKTGLRTYATGIRNGVGLAVDPVKGDLWTSTNERDGLGDDLVPDYVTRVKPHGFYGWPWWYMGNHEDPRHVGERPDLKDKAIVPDVLLQAHSASLGLCFYTATSGAAAFPAEYQGDVFAAEHGSWNRTVRTGYKVIRVRLDHGVPTAEYDDFMTGFVVDNHSVWGRPVGVAVAHDGALLVTDDAGGLIWRVAYVGKK